jgi:uncharacterized damage-inducible protein DinB
LLMQLTEFFLAELEREVGLSRSVLERVPQGRNDWKPHEKSMRLGYLAALVASMPGWIDMMIHRASLNLGQPGGGGFTQRELDTREELLQLLEDSSAKGRRALEDTSDEHLMSMWSFQIAGRVVMEKPRHVMLQESVFSHMAHHRGQLTVYLRLNDAAVPAVYGPSADERPPGV